jgi:hypothetical protein
VWTPPPPRPSPAQVRFNAQQALRANPAEGLRGLNHPDVRTTLVLAERVALAREGVEVLATKVEAGGNSVKALGEVRAARGAAAEIDQGVTKSLDNLARVAERRVLSEGLTEVQAQAERGQWPQAAQKAQEWLGRLNEPALRAAESAEFRAGRAATGEALREVTDVGRRLEALDGFQKGLGALDGNRPGEAAAALKKVDPATLPEPLRGPAEGLRGLAELREAAAARWEKAPDAAALRDSAARFGKGLGELPGADAALAREVMQDLAVKALLEGHPDAFKALLPEHGPAEHAATLLRDLKATALGGGKVETWPLGRALAPEPGLGPAGPRGPPAGLKPLMPEGAREGWRPPVKEGARADLPPLEKANDVGLAMKGRAEAQAKPERKALDGRAQAAAARLGAVRQTVLAPEREERKQLAEVEAALDRRLRPAERVRLRDLVAQKKETDLVAAFRAQPGPGEDEEFLLEVKKRLGRELTDAEKKQAVRLRKAGRMAAEVADIFRP